MRGEKDVKLVGEYFPFQSPFPSIVSTSAEPYCENVSTEVVFVSFGPLAIF